MGKARRTPVWRMGAQVMAQRLRSADPLVTSQSVADEIILQVVGAPSQRDPVLQRIRSWERTGVVARRQRRMG